MSPEQELFIHVARVLAATLDLEAVLQAIAEAGAELLGMETGAVYLIEPDRQLYLGAAVPPLSPEMPAALRWASLSDHPHIREAASSGETIVLPDALTAELSPAERDVVEFRGLRTLVFLPLRYEENTVGVLILGSTSGTRDLSERQLELCRALADQVSLGVQNARLHARLKDHAARLEAEVAERTRVEKALRATEQRFGALLEQAGDYILVLQLMEDGDVVIVDANQRAHEVHGYTRDEFLGRSVLELDRGLSREEGEAIVRRVDSGRMALVETVHARKDGTEFPVEVSLTSLDLGDGRRYLLSVERDISERKRSEAHLVERAEFERSLLAATPVSVVTLARDGTVLSWNPTASRTFGWSADDVVGRTLPTVPQEGLVDLTDLIEMVWDGRIVTQLERVHLSRSGERIHVSISAAPIRDAEGRVTAVVATIADITRRKVAEQALAGERELLRKITETSPVGITVVDAKGDIVFTNPFAEQVLGIPSRDDEARRYDAPAWEITTLDGDPFPESSLPFRRVQETLEPVYDVRHAIRGRDGDRVFLSVNAAPLLDANGAFEGMVAAIQDITEPVTTARSLDWSREEYRLLFTNAISGVAVHEIMLDGNGEPVDYVFLAVNPSFERITGLRASAVLGKRVTEVLPGIEETDLIRRYGAVALSGIPETFEDFVEVLDKHFVIHAYKVSERRFATAFEDVTERVRSEEGRLALERQLREAQKMEAIARLAGGIAHDFNNMLAVIIGASDMALQEIEPGTTLYQDIASVHDAATRSAELTKQLLAFSRTQVIHPTATNLDTIVAAQQRILRRLLGEEVRLDVESSDELWNVFIDPSQVDQIIANLVVNARDAIEGAEGVVTIKTANALLDADPTAEHFPVAGGDYVVLSVSDNGAGIAPEVLAQIFEPFYTTKALGQGTGLGLSTVYGIVKQNEGVIRVHSKPGIGTTFEVYLPRHRGKAERVKAAGSGLIRGSETILVVEDEEAILSLARRFLQGMGYRVLTAGSPSAALDIVRAYDGPLHLLLTDVVLPEMNGRQLQERLLELRPGMRTVFMSGYDADVVAHRGVLEEGVTFIQKPFTMRALTQRLRQILDAE